MDNNYEILVERIEGLKTLINTRFDENRSVNQRIEDQFEKTNGRVNSLESWKDKIAGVLIIMSMIVVPLFVQYLKNVLLR